MSLATVGDVNEQSLGDSLVSARKNTKSIEEHDARTTQGYKDLVVDTLETLDRVSVVAASLHFFSKNECLDDISTESLKFMLISAYQGMVHQNHFDFDNRKAHVLAAKEYYRDFHHLCRMYGLAKEIEFELNRIDNPVSDNTRDAKIQAYKDKEQLEDMLSELEKRQNVDEEVQREIYLSQIKIWLLRCEEELYNINSELPMLEHRDKLRGGHVTSKPPIKPKVLKPFILVKSELQKQVYGAGYPSLPTVTLDEYYDQELKKVIEEQERQKQEPLPVVPEDPDEETEESLQKARNWDDWKDTHKKGWGNRHNRS